EALRLIREEDPPPPSTRLSTTDGLPTIASKRGLEPQKLRRQIRGELDWIVMKALEKDRNHRYQTANSLAMDLRRYLADEAVQACPPSAGYRLRKFVRRHKGPVLATVIVFLSLVGGIVGATWGMIKARRAEQNAVRAQEEEAQRADGERKARQEARARLEQIEKGNEILTSVFTNLDPREEKEGRPLRAILSD